MLRSSKPKKCPRCKHEPMATVVVEPPADADLISGEYIFHGCNLQSPNEETYMVPSWGCIACDLEIWQRVKQV